MPSSTDDVQLPSSAATDAYWRTQLSRVVRQARPRPRLPRPPGVWTKTARARLEIAGPAFQALSSVTGGDAFLQCAAIIAAAAVCLHRYTELSPVAIGCAPLRDRQSAAADQSGVAVVCDLDERTTFRQLLQQVRARMLDAYKHDGESLSRIVNASDDGSPAIGVVYKGLHADSWTLEHDVTLSIEPGVEGLHLECSFSSALYDPAAIERFADQLVTALQSGLAHLESSVVALDVMSAAERSLLATWSERPAPDTPATLVHELFESWARVEPRRVALVYGETRMDYGELDERSNQLAHHLRWLGVGADMAVGICMPRCPELIVSVLAVLKAGGAYVAYDPSYPQQRLALMFEDVRLKALLTKDALLGRLPPSALSHAVCVDRDATAIAAQPVTKPDVTARPEHLCYIIFTSGSTGRPKAAAVSHGGWANLLRWFGREFAIDRSDKTLVMSSFSFDITQRSIAEPLTTGGALHLLASDDYDPQLILRTIERERITLMNCAPSTFYPLIDLDPSGANRVMQSLRCLFLGGEAISASRLLAWARSPECATEVVNVYGAAECSDVSSFYRLRDYERYAATSVPIGEPIDSTRVYVVDDAMTPTPVGVAGEICLAGAGVGRGYINDRRLTAEKFVDDPHADGKLYRTGDRGRWLADGMLEFAGRTDHQVKIRGQRIELGEIETGLRLDPSVKEAAASVRHTVHGATLVAYVVPHQPERAVEDGFAEQLRARLGAILPAHMVPAAIVPLASLPLTPNGKIDREALPEPPAAVAHDADAPTTEIERTLMQLYAEVLGVPTLGRNDDFFSLGGHSLLATRLIARIRETFGVNLSAETFFADQTVAGLARTLGPVSAE